MKFLQRNTKNNVERSCYKRRGVRTSRKEKKNKLRRRRSDHCIGSIHQISKHISTYETKSVFSSCAPVGISSPNPLNSNQRIPIAKYGAATRYAAQSSSSTNRRITNSQMHYPVRSVDTCGKILKITLRDFMNHDKLDIDPGLHINILTGPNGAGKSSILQGIVLGLGKQ